MKHSSATIAILFFCRRAGHEAREKHWVHPKHFQQNRRIAYQLIQHTQAVVARSGLPVVCYHESQQRGHSFGERLANAFQDLFDRGYQAVVAVGNDTPALEQVSWEAVCKQLASGQPVIGPTYRAGAYLIGLTAASFQKDRFEALPWQTPRLLPSLLYYVTRGSQEAILLPEQHDLNSYHDILRFLKTPAVSSLARSLTLIIQNRPPVLQEVHQCYTPHHFAYRSLRAPPAL